MMVHFHRHEAVAKAINLAIGLYREISLAPEVIQEWMRSGLSMAGVALAYGLNSTMLPKWVTESECKDSRNQVM